MGGMPGSYGGAAPKPKVTANLVLTLEQLFTGCTKKLKIKRSSKKLQREDAKVVEVNVKPGWKAGTKITFANEGDELPNGQARHPPQIPTSQPPSSVEPTGLSKARAGPDPNPNPNRN